MGNGKPPPPPTGGAPSTFTMPPPQASGTAVIEESLMNPSGAELSLFNVSERLTKALNSCGYGKISYSPFTERSEWKGFAVITRLERIEESGEPEEDEFRWVVDDDLGSFGLKKY